MRRAAGSRACLFVREVRRYVPALIGRARAAGLKVIFEAHNVSASLVREKEAKAPSVADDLRARARERAALEKSIIQSADGLICTQHATLEGLKPLLGEGTPTVVLGNGTRIPPTQADRPKDIDVLYCGSLKRWKGVDRLVAAMHALHPYELTIVGPARKEDLRRLQHAATAAGVAGRVKILPPLRPADIWDLYARAKVGVIPLPREEFVEARDFTSPLKLFEMMAAGVPLVASRLRSISEYVTDGREALLVAPDDPKALADGIRKMLSDEALRAGLASAARSRAAEFTWDDRGRRILAFAEGLFG